jgi:predicted metal-dependent hydrolase
MIQKLKQQLQYGTKTIEYSIIKSRRIKTSEIIVDADNVSVRSPFHKPVSEIHEIVRKKAGWILKKQLEYKNQNPEIMKPNFQDSSTLPYSGKNYTLNIISNYQGRQKIEFENGEFSIYIKGKSSKTKARLLYEKWLTETAQSFLIKKLKTIPRNYQLNHNKLNLGILGVGGVA